MICSDSKRILKKFLRHTGRLLEQEEVPSEDTTQQIADIKAHPERDEPPISVF
jgi:hypothetical protein